MSVNHETLALALSENRISHKTGALITWAIENYSPASNADLSAPGLGELSPENVISIANYLFTNKITESCFNAWINTLVEFYGTKDVSFKESHEGFNGPIMIIDSERYLMNVICLPDGSIKKNKTGHISVAPVLSQPLGVNTYTAQFYLLAEKQTLRILLGVIRVALVL